MAATFVFLIIAIALGVMLGIGGACVLVDLYTRARYRLASDDSAFDRFRRVFGPREDDRA